MSSGSCGCAVYLFLHENAGPGPTDDSDRVSVSWYRGSLGTGWGYDTSDYE